MNRERFEDVLATQIKRVQDVLVVKAAEYATEDRLANFKQAANLRGVSITQAISGMMVKHTVSIYNMIESGESFSLDKWDEKLTDHINYLILLRAALVEQDNPDGENFFAKEDDYVYKSIHPGSGE